MITTQKEGRRVYLSGNTYSLRDKLRSLGATWDPDRKQWWVGTSKQAEVLALLERSTTESDAPAQNRAAPGKNAAVAGKATYKGKTYYVAGKSTRGGRYAESVEAVTTQDGAKVLLLSRDGSMQFWATLQTFGHIVIVGAAQPTDVAVITQTYQRPQTIAGLERFAEEVRKEGSPELVAARRRGWDGCIGSPSYYTSGAFDEIDF